MRVPSALALLLLPGLAAASIRSAPLPADPFAEIAAVQARMVRGLSPERRAAVMEAQIFLVPEDKRIIDAAPEILRAILDRPTADAVMERIDAHFARLMVPGSNGSLPDDPRGLTARFLGVNVVFVGVENLRSTGPRDSKGRVSRRTLVHELGHVVHGELDDDTKRRFSQLASVSWPEMAQGEGAEYFAGATEIWFDVHQNIPSLPSRTPAYLRATHPRIAEFMQSVYGAPVTR